MKGLLNKNKQKRITIDEMISHEYFIDYKFNDILEMNFFSPLKPYCLEFKD